VPNIKTEYLTKVHVDAYIRHERSLVTAGLELTYDVNLDGVMGAGEQDDVFRVERNDDRLQVAVNVTRRSELTTTPLQVYAHIHQLENKALISILSNVSVESPARAGYAHQSARGRRRSEVARQSIRKSR
jgi:hypothetical protein